MSISHFYARQPTDLRRYTERAGPCTICDVTSQRLNITLDEERAAKLSRLAARVHVNEGTLARSLLSSALDDTDPDVERVVDVLEGIDGAWERVQAAREQAASGETVGLADL